MSDLNHQRHHRRTPLSYRSQVQLNIELITQALCSQALLCRFDPAAAADLMAAAENLERITDRVGGCHD